LPAHVDLHNHLRKLRRKRPLHLTLLDPGKSDTATIGRLAHGAAQAGTDAIMVGGSTGLSLERVDAAVLEIKAQTHLPVILFPTVAKAVSTKADAIFFMSLLNSSERRFLVGEQIESAAMVHQSGLQLIRQPVQSYRLQLLFGLLFTWPADQPRHATYTSGYPVDTSSPPKVSILPATSLRRATLISEIWPSTYRQLGPVA